MSKARCVLLLCLLLLASGCWSSSDEVPGAPLPSPGVALPPTGMPATVVTPGAQLTEVPVPTTRSPAAPGLSPPPPQVDLREVGDRLWSLGSFAFDFERPEPYFHLQGRWVQTPLSWHIVETHETGSLEYVVIGERAWTPSTLVDGLPVSCIGWEQQPENSLTYVSCKAGVQLLSTALELFTYFVYDQQAVFVAGPIVVDGIVAYEYAWQDEARNDCRLYVEARTGIPVTFECADLTYRFSGFNDPANIIAPPTSEMPGRLHIDDARMALNGLYSFQYVTEGEVWTKSGTSAYYVEGVYVQENLAWHANWRWIPEDEAPFWEFVTLDKRTWVREGEATTWIAASWDREAEEAAREAAPFAGWPDSFLLQRGARQPASARTIAGLECHEYVFAAAMTSDDGYDLTTQVRLWVAAEGTIPLRIETFGDAGGAGFFIAQELSNLDDPSNSVKPPEDYVDGE